MRFLGLLVLVAGAQLRATVRQQQHARAKGGLGEVIKLLQTMLAKFDQHTTADKQNWAQYQADTDEQERDRQAFVEEQQNLKAEKTALLNAKRDVVQKLTADLSGLAGEIAETEKSLQELAAMRASEHEQHEAELADLMKTITAVTKALEVLAGHYAVTPAAFEEIKHTVQLGLTQLQFGAELHGAQPKIPQGAVEFLQSTQDPRLSVDGSQFENYQVQGGGATVLSMLNDMRGQLEDSKSASIQRENDSRAQYEETRAAKEGELQRMKKEQAEKQNLKANAEAAIEVATATIDQANQDIADAEAMLQQLKEDREKFSSEFDERNRMRSNERAATQAALDALQSVSAGNTAAALTQVQAQSGLEMQAPAFVQVRQMPEGVNPAMVAHAATILGAIEAPSPAVANAASTLSLMAQQQPGYMETQQNTYYDEDSMAPVKELLHKLVARLEAEQSEETSHHDWCNDEKAQSVKSQAEREGRIHGLKERVESGTTSVAQLKTEILFLQDELARVARETEEAIALREQEHKQFLTAKQDHDEVITALEGAINALAGQYGFLQGGQAQSPFGAYESGAAGAASVLEMLQDLLNRYAESRADLVQNEEEAQAAHEKLLKDNEQFRVDTTNTKNSKTSERRETLGQLTTNKAELKQSMLELQQVNQYIGDLRPSCDDIRSTFEERKKRREAEIAALKEALAVISDPASR